LEADFQESSKRGPIPKKPNETGNFRGDHRPKKNHENGGQKPTQKRWDNRRRDQPQNDRKTNQSSPVPVEPSTSPDQLAIHEHQPDGLLGEQKIEEMIHWIRKAGYLRNCTKLRKSLLGNGELASLAYGSLKLLYEI
jgi:hypothetical protein